MIRIRLVRCFLVFETYSYVADNVATYIALNSMGVSGTFKGFQSEDASGCYDYEGYMLGGISRIGFVGGWG